MDEQTLRDVIEEQLGKLTPRLREFVTSSSWSDFARELSRQNGLSDTIALSLENEILFVLLGLEAQDDFEKNFAENEGITAEQAAGVGALTRENVFRSVAEDLKLLNRRQEAAEDLALAGEEGNTLLDRDRVLKSIENPETSHASDEHYEYGEATLSGLETARDRGYDGGTDPYREPVK